VPFEEAKEYAQKLNLQSSLKWYEWVKQNGLPQGMRRNPQKAYKNKGWKGWGDFLGTGLVKTQERKFRSYNETQKFIRSLGIQTQPEWHEWKRIPGRRPHDIPAEPSSYYQKEWISWANFLGTRNTRSTGFLSFEDARDYVRNLGLKSWKDWRAWSQSDERPADIPADPLSFYKNKGWIGINDWLGVVNLWTKGSILSFLKGLVPILPSLDPAELFCIMRQNGMLRVMGGNFSYKYLNDVIGLITAENPELEAEKVLAKIEGNLPDIIDNSVDLDSSDGGESELSEISLEGAVDDEKLPDIDCTKILNAIDSIKELYITDDEEAVEFLVSKAVSKIWKLALRDEENFRENLIADYPAGEYSKQVAERFLAQFHGAQGLMIPQGYDFKVGGSPTAPNLMQRLIAYRIQTENRIGNWSGTGAGKTLAAVLASRVIESKLTVIVAVNNTLKGWEEETQNAFPDSQVICKERGELNIDPDKATYIILNFESFQQIDSASMVQSIVNNHDIDMIVVDEVHCVKQTANISSKRRQVIGGLLSLATEKNPDLRVLGMSATPVVNNLFEAVSLLEMVTGKKYDELDTRATIGNAIAIHEKLTLNGVRYKPKYKMQLSEKCIEIFAPHLLSRLVKIKKGDVLGFEQILLESKIDTILSELRPGTLIYTIYVDEIVPLLRSAVEKAGFSVGVFTGSEKMGLEDFLNGKVDVLIGSSTLGLGVDGLQYVCNRLIIATLPWTSAAYEQVIGRIYRQGSKFRDVDIIIPQVALENNGDKWSWDIQRKNRIDYKKTLADATIDGLIPEGMLEPPSKMLAKTVGALKAWIDRLEEQEDLSKIERQKLVIPLPDEVRKCAVRRFGDFSKINARWNTSYSRTTHTKLHEDPAEWYLYHTLYRKAREDWAEVPFEKFIEWLKDRPHLVVGDFGCGEADIAKSVSNQVYSFDHIAVNEKVKACDMAHTELDNEVLDVAVFSLSLMGKNIEDYIAEAHRTLKLDGFLKVAESASRWEAEKKEKLIEVLEKAGFQIIGQVQERGKFIYINAIKSESRQS